LTGAWDSSRPTEGAYTALLTFDDGVIASLTYSGYGHFDGDEFCGGISELGAPKDASAYGAARRALHQVATAAEEAALKNARNYGGTIYSMQSGSASADRTHPATAPWHEHFGCVLVSCDHADLRPLPTGVMVYGDTGIHLDPLPKPDVPRAEVIDELYGAVVGGQQPLHGGRWAMATIEVCLAILQSAREQRDVPLVHQRDEPCVRG
jgi:phthalate 4,5-cis-dihydrodiol dehydrogenase